jgi:DNA-binding CsgD family transcriptional regulator
MIRELAGHYVFHISAYIIIFSGYKKVPGKALRNGLKGYLILGMVIVPLALIYQAGISFGVITIIHTEIPFPYIVYCILFNILCIVNTFRYLFIPGNEQAIDIQETFLRECGITGREKEVIELLLRGYNNKQTAAKLFISERTVKNHIYNIYGKTGVKNRVQLVTRVKG